MIIKITNFPIGIHKFCFEKNVKELGLEKPFVENLTLDCKLDKASHQIVLSCKLSVNAELSCDRCNSIYISNLGTEFKLVYIFEPIKLTDDDFNTKIISPSTEKIDITPEVLDYVRLSIPMKNLCKEDCKGLCLSCGANLNEVNCQCSKDNLNPLWDPLIRIKNNQN